MTAAHPDRPRPRTRRQPWSVRGLAGLLFVLLGVTGLLLAGATGQPARPVLVVPIHGPIDLGVAPFLQRTLREAAEQNARAVLLDINTPGGRLDAVLQMRQAMLDSSVRTIAFVNREAFSAGALIAIAANDIYMAPGAVMGAATPVNSGGGAVDAKTVSAVRSTFRSTAELRERDPLVAEAMVDPDVVIPKLVRRGQLLTLTTTQARQRGYADGVAANREAVLRAAGLEGAPVREVSVSMAENVVRFLTNPVVASLLTSIGFLLILGDVYTGGFGVLGAAGILLFALFFWGHFLAGLAGWEGVALTVLGLVLLALEVFVIPGFGIAGILGVAALLGGVFMSVIGRDVVTGQDVVRATSIVAGTLLVIVAGALTMLRFLPRAARTQGLVLTSSVDTNEIPHESALQPGSAGRPRWQWLEGERMEAQSRTHATGAPSLDERASLVGSVGTALTDLRPGGIAVIHGERVDVVTQGDYVHAGEAIEVIADEGYRRVVRRTTSNAKRAVRE